MRCRGVECVCECLLDSSWGCGDGVIGHFSLVFYACQMWHCFLAVLNRFTINYCAISFSYTIPWFQRIVSSLIVMLCFLCMWLVWVFLVLGCLIWLKRSCGGCDVAVLYLAHFGYVVFSTLLVMT